MNCPKCAAPSSVMETRQATGRVRRRRTCAACDHRFTTLECIASSDERSWKDAHVVFMPKYAIRDVKAMLERLIGLLDPG